MHANTGFVKFRSPVAAVAAALLLASGAQAATVSWYGGGNGSWQDSWRWSSFAQPGSTDDVYVTWPSAYGATIMVSSGYPPSQAPVEIGSLTVGASNRIEVYARTLQVAGAIFNDGELVLSQSSYSAPSTFKIGSDTTLAGTGRLLLNYGSALDLNGRTLTIGSAQTVRGAGDIGNGNLINQGLLVADGVLSFYPGANTVDNSAGQISIGAQGILSVNRTSFTGGRITSASGGTLMGSGSAFSPTFSKVLFEGDAKLGGNMALVDAANKGVLRIDGPFETVSVQRALVNDGSIYVDKTLGFQGDARLTGSGTVWLRRSNFPYPSASIGTLDVAANSTLTIDNTQTVRGAGRIRGATDSHIVNHGSVIAEGGTLALFAGDGSFDNSAGRLIVAHDATIGTMGTLILGDASMLSFDVGSSAVDHGKINVMSSMPQALDGTLQLNIGYSAHVGDSFTLLSAGSGVTGSFDLVTAAGYTLSTSFSAGDLTVTITGVTAVPEPASWLLAGVGLLMVGRRLRKQA